MRVLIFVTVLILMGCLIGGCSKTNLVTSQQKLDHRNDEPFMATIREIATKRKDFYFIGQPIDKREFEFRKNDLSSQIEFNLRNPGAGEHFMGIPVFLKRF